MQLAIITHEQYATQAWRRPGGYGFAAQFNVLPMVVAELVKVALAMPMAFVKSGDTFQLVAVTSLQSGVNLFVTPDGKWIGDYVPATLRAYPFKLAKPQDRDDLVLCFDVDSGLLTEPGQGEPFFEGEAPTAVVQQAMNILTDFEASGRATRRVVDALHGAELIQPWLLNLQQGETTVPVEGLFRVDELGLNALSDTDFVTLRSAGALSLAYAQLLSMNQMTRLQKAAEVQAGIREQMHAASQPKTALNLKSLYGDTLKFT